MTQPHFKDSLGVQPLVFDGSIRFELHRRGCTEEPPDIYVLRNPALVETIHRDFLEAGASIIQAATQNSNRLILEKHGLSDKVYELNRKAVWIARCAALHKAYVAGVVGPTGRFFSPVGSLTSEEARRVFIEQIVALVDGGADLLLLKSFIDPDELEIAIEAARFVNDAIPVIALKAFPEDGTVLSSSYPSDIARRLAESHVVAIGSSSTIGPQRMFDVIRSLAVVDLPLCALPDTAIPTLTDGKPQYNAEPEYVASVIRKMVEAGIQLVGADGGAGIEHVKAIADAVRNTDLGMARMSVREAKPPKHYSLPEAPPSLFAQHIGNKFMTTVEVEIPRGLDMDSVIDAAKFLKDAGIDAVNVFDGARARVRISPVAASYLIQRDAGIECITHIACRDRNIVGLQADLIGAHGLGLRNILAVTGDPTSIGDHPYANSVYDIDSIGLMRVLGRMNQGQDLVGNTLGRPTNFLLCCAVNPAADDLDREIRRLEQKVDEGLQVAFTQPLFEMPMLERFLDKIAHLRVHIMLGIIPLRTARHAEFLHYEVPGMVVPDWVRRTMSEGSPDVESSMERGLDIAARFLEAAKQFVAGAYVMPPSKKYNKAIELLTRAGIQLTSENASAISDAT